MTFKHRLAALPAAAALLAALVPSFALAGPSSVAAEGKDVVSVTPLENTLSADEVTEGLTRDDALGSALVAEDGTVLPSLDDYTSDDSTRRAEDAVSASTTRPRAFDLRSADLNGDGKPENYVTSVKNQGYVGACWAFGSLAASETSLLSELGTPVEGEGDPIDLSEKHLAWFASVPLSEKVDPTQAGEGYYTNLDPVADSAWLMDFGGAISYVSTLFSAGTGPRTEAEFPYVNAEGEYVEDEGFDVASPEGDWSLPAEEERNGSVAELEESFYLPSPASYEDETESGYVFNQEGVDAIKDQLLAGRGVGISFHADQSTFGEPSETFYLNPTTYAHYTYDTISEGATPDHLVCIVGYDDDYAKENFLEGHQPPANGAFIVKNSWGSLNSGHGNQGDWGIDGDGYFYLSYYDKSLYRPEAFDFVTANDDDLTFGKEAGESYTSHQYHNLATGDESVAPYEEVVSMANIFEVDEPSVVRTVFTRTFSFNTKVRFALYRLNDGAKDPTSGTLLWSHDEAFEFGGYHRVELDEPVVVQAGERLGVVVTTELPDGTFEVNRGEGASELNQQAMEADPSYRLWSETVVNEGESFVGAPSAVTEFSDGSQVYSGYDWEDVSFADAESKKIGWDVVNKTNLAELIAARDEAYEAYLALGEDDPGYTEAEAAFYDAQDAVLAEVDAIPDEGAGAFYVEDNFPVGMTTEAYDPANPPTGLTVEMYRLYNPYTGEHLYTRDANERASLVAGGWSDEGTGWTAPKKSSTPVYRLYNSYTGEHLYTCDSVELSALKEAGWNDEGVAFYSSSSHATPVYRLYNPYNPGLAAHHFTIDPTERDHAIRNGWRNEGIAWYSTD